ncbi:hypothetical protein C7B65_04750 [Phormidesmis priestleyi ULC007]|uniref:Uncharacterized protein n=1 Tax=Phormidesmis priestleyi ULC007 TaxID=1920490 RepID=A0A2T1DL91_9CYAN|nr:hypothetical protein [Phormidesmis priestleyi]PSB21242.1 hypothetical protein C7B65_04750 [Phormidesmis priestleyi ULC007]PZO51230.1 MAG: hypothetical protein DCF14_08955 [Phormidesmis priestleyi]
MPQDEPNQSDETELPQPSVAQSPTSEQTGIQILPWLRSVSIRLLRTTVQGLEGTIAKLEADTSTGATLPISPKLQTQMRSLWERIGSLLKKFWQWFVPVWEKLLTQIRTRLPENLSQKLNDRALSSVVASLLIVVLWTTSNLFASKPPTKVAIAPQPAQKTIPVSEPASKPIQPDFGSPAPQPIPTELTAPEPEKPAPTIASPVAEPIAPSPPVVEPAPPIEEPAPEPEKPAPPVIELTPEQKLIASIQDQVVTVADPYSSGLIETIKPNFNRSRLSVSVGDDWYGLSRSQQDKLGDELLKRSQELDFSKLEITDAQGTLLARSPVVGSTMVILQRKADAPETV